MKFEQQLLRAMGDMEDRFLMEAMEYKKKKADRARRGMIAAAVAVAVTAMLVTAAAAYEKGWFGFDRIFGEKAALVEQDVISYEETAPADGDLSPEDMLKIAAGEVEDPFVGATVSDITDYRFTLESMLAGQDSIYAVICMEPLTEYGQQNMGLAVPEEIEFYLTNQSSSGGMRTELLDCDGLTAHYLAIWTGNEANAVGDMVSIEVYLSAENKGYPLFSQEITDIVDGEAVIDLDPSVYDTELEYFDKLTITPLSMTIEGWFNYAYGEELTEAALAGGKTKEDVDIRPYMRKTPKVTITLQDGTAFSLKDNTTDTEFMPYGTYGSLSSTGYGDRETGQVVNTWTFSQVVDLSEIACITVDGVDYTLGE